MLHFETIDSRTLDLLVKLQRIPAFSELRLVGGTALALQIGHRKSVDLDFFGTITADEYELSKQLTETGQATILKKTENINIYVIDGIKTEIVNFHYKWLVNPLIESGLVLAGMEDIAAMKLAAITGRGTKKDFIDLYFLLKHFSLKQMLDFYLQKYPDGSEFNVLKSLSYFDDAEEDEIPVMLHPLKWGTVKKIITSSLENYLKNRAGRADL
ncbi:MAG: nucleotidyl transferase AbiEii/AbiGii toxin family protein [Bacteroidales bacterium]